MSAQNDRNVCYVCDLEFSEKSTLDQHMRSLHSLDGMVYKCHVCFQVYAMENHLNIHLRTHKKVKKAVVKNSNDDLQIIEPMKVVTKVKRVTARGRRRSGTASPTFTSSRPSSTSPPTLMRASSISPPIGQNQLTISPQGQIVRVVEANEQPLRPRLQNTGARQDIRPFIFLSTEDKCKMMFSWFVESSIVDLAMNNNYLIEFSDIENSPERIPTKILDESVCLDLLKGYFSVDAWSLIKSVTESKRGEKSLCEVCKEDADMSFTGENISILCDACLDWFHMPCAGLNQAPNEKFWYCQSCVSNNNS